MTNRTIHAPTRQWARRTATTAATALLLAMSTAAALSGRSPAQSPAPSPPPVPPPVQAPVEQPAATDAAPPGQTDVTPDRFPCDGWSRRPVFKLGQDHRVRAGESVRDAVVVFGSTIVDGDVCGDLVVVFGNVELSPTAFVRDSMTVVGGRVSVAEGAAVEGDMVVVGGALEAPASFGPGRELVLVGVPVLGDHLLGVVPWMTRGLLYGRLIVPDLAWNWYIVAATLFVCLLLNVLFPRATALTTGVIQARPISAFAAGLLVLLLSAPVITLLAITVIGAALIPFVVGGMFAGWIIGSIGVARWIGASLLPQDDLDDRVASSRSLLIGFAIKVVAYVIPLVGLTAWALGGVLALGAASLAFIGAFRAEHPRKSPPVAPPPVPPSVEAPLAAGQPQAYAEAAAAASGPGSSSASAAPAPPRPEPPPLPGESADLRRFARGSFVERLGAFVLDVVLVALINGALDLTDREGGFFFLLLVYHVVAWAWKGTTIGGLIMQLRLVRVDGRRVELTDAVVRGLTAIFSLGALGLGCLWILKDDQRQAWHDMVAGTLVVRVPRGWPLP